MPCSSSHMEPTKREREESQGIASQLKYLADQLTHSSDVLREYLLGNVEHTQVMKHVNRDATRAKSALIEKAQRLYVKVSPQLISHVEDLVVEYNWLNAFATRQQKMRPVDFEKIKADQIKHRQEDIQRLIKTFANSGDIANLRRVLDANANSPLAPQLGFDPDDF